MKHRVTSGDSSPQPGSLSNRFWRFAFLTLMVLECSPLWVYRYFPSQDGPSHLHNASVLADYGTELIYRQYYRRTPLQPAGNMVTQFLLAGLLKFTGPVRAEQLLLTGYVVLLFLSFRYLLKGLTPYAEHFSLFAGILVSNYFLYMGFWNYCYSVCFLLFTLGYYVRQQMRWTGRSLTVLGLGGFLVYLTHAVSWVICVVAVAILGLAQPIEAILSRRDDPTSATIRRATLQYVLPVSSLLPPGLFMLMYLMRWRGKSTCDVIAGSMRERLWHLYSLSFLHTIAPSDVRASKAVAATLFLAMVYVAGVSLRRRQYNWPSTTFLALSAVCAVIALAGPDCVASGSFIHMRVAFYAWLFLVVWLALQSWPPLALNAITAVWCGIAIIALVARYPALSRWDQKISNVVALGENIRPRSTVLLLNLERVKVGVNPYEHAVGFLSAKAIIDLRNYEPSKEYFPTGFQPERSPFPMLGTLKELEAVPPVFDILRYEKQTQGRVDYVVFEGDAPVDSDGKGTKPLESKLYGNQLANYTLVSLAEGGNLRLYERARGSADERVGPDKK